MSAQNVKKIVCWSGLAALSALCLSSCGTSTEEAPRVETRSLALSVFEAPARIVAHRGGAAYAPENTIQAVENAVRLHVDAVEVDVHYTLFGDVVVFHGDSLGNVTDCVGRLIEASLQTLQACDAGHWWMVGRSVTSSGGPGPFPYRGKGIGIPRLGDVLQRLSEFGAEAPVLVIDIKLAPEQMSEPAAWAAATAVVGEIVRARAENRVIISSFIPDTLRAVKNMGRGIATARILDREINCERAVSEILRERDEMVLLSVESEGFSSSCVESLRRIGKLVVVYTANNPATISELSSLGVNGIVTDWPACALGMTGRESEVDPYFQVEAGTVTGPYCLNAQL